MLTSLLNLLHQRYGRPCQVIGTGSWTAAVYAGNPDVGGVWSFHRHLPFLLERSWLKVRRALRDSAPGPIYICERHYRQLPRIRRILRWSGIDPKRCVYLSDEAVTGSEHLVDRLVRLGTRTPAALKATDYPAPALSAVDGPRLYVLPAEKAARDAWLRAQGWYGHKLILIQPGNHRSMGPQRARWRRLNSDDKWWPLERWAALLQRIHDQREKTLLVLRGSPEELPMLEEIRTAAHRPRVVVAGIGLRELFALCDTAHSMWVTSRCISWIRAVTCEGTTMATSHSARISPPSRPMRPLVCSPRARASRNPASTLGLRPEVEIPTATSPRQPRPAI